MDYTIERQQALDAGYRALESLREARAQIGDARGLGIWDLLGGRQFVSFFKHMKIARAREAIDRARYDLDYFCGELRDINVNLNINISDLLTVFDLFDNFFADVMVQSRIADASRRLDEAIYRVEEILKQI